MLVPLAEHGGPCSPALSSGLSIGGLWGEACGEVEVYVVHVVAGDGASEGVCLQPSIMSSCLLPSIQVDALLNPTCSVCVCVCVCVCMCVFVCV